MSLPKDILQQPMTRKEFLQYGGGLLLVMIGINNFIAAMQHSSESDRTQVVQSGSGFGTRKFGM